MSRYEIEAFENVVRMILDSPSLDNMQKETIERLLSEIRRIFTERAK